jgi:AcrR family transcriptional regulator
VNSASRLAAERPLVLDRASIARVAMELVDADGIDALNMRRLGAELGVGASALYRYVPDKQALLDLLVDCVYAEIEAPEITADWRQRVVAYCDALRAALLSHPHLAPIVACRPVMGHAGVGILEVALAELAELGFDAESARRIVDVIVSFVMGHVLTEVSALPSLGGHQHSEVARFRSTLGHERFPLSAASLGRNPPDRDAEFGLGVQFLVAGIERELAAIGH